MESDRRRDDSDDAAGAGGGGGRGIVVVEESVKSIRNTQIFNLRRIPFLGFRSSGKRSLSPSDQIISTPEN